MTRYERWKAILNAVAATATNALVPAVYRLALAALVEEAQEQEHRIAELEIALLRLKNDR